MFFDYFNWKTLMDKRTTAAKRFVNPNDRAMAHGVKAVSRATLSRITSLSQFHRFLLLNHDAILDAAEGRKINWKGFLAQPEIVALDLRDGKGNRISEGRASRMWWEVRKYYETQNSAPTTDPSASKPALVNQAVVAPVARTVPKVPVVRSPPPSGHPVAHGDPMQEILGQFAAEEVKRHGYVPKLVQEIEATISANSREREDETPKK
ncbi:hypothetical protein [Acidiphilium rubrum]|nr:hypothetical protein [Acidiphilium rubrum]